MERQLAPLFIALIILVLVLLWNQNAVYFESIIEPDEETGLLMWDDGGSFSCSVGECVVNTNCLADEGVLCWDTDSNTLFIGDGTSAIAVGSN